MVLYCYILLIVFEATKYRNFDKRKYTSCAPVIMCPAANIPCGLKQPAH